MRMRDVPYSVRAGIMALFVLVMVLVYAVAFAVIMVTVVNLFFPARAHSWYDAACCSERDCHPIPPLRETPAGYVWNSRIVPHAETKPSADNQFHECVNSSGTLLCLYVPPRGM